MQKYQSESMEGERGLPPRVTGSPAFPRSAV